MSNEQRRQVFKSRRGEIRDPHQGYPTPVTVDNNVVYDLNMQVSNEKEEKDYVKNENEKQNKNFINVVSNPLNVDNLKKLNVVKIQAPEEKFETDYYNNLEKVTENSQKTKNIVSNVEINFAKNEITTNETNLEIVSNESGHASFYENERDPTKTDCKVATVPVVMRMNVKMPLVNLDSSQMSVQIVDAVQQQFQKQIVIPIEDSQHVVQDDVQMMTRQQDTLPPTLSSERTRSTSRITVMDLSSSRGKVNSETEQKSLINLSDSSKNFYGATNFLMDYQQPQTDLYDQSRVNLAHSEDPEAIPDDVFAQWQTSTPYRPECYS